MQFIWLWMILLWVHQSILQLQYIMLLLTSLLVVSVHQSLAQPDKVANAKHSIYSKGHNEEQSFVPTQLIIVQWGALVLDKGETLQEASFYLNCNWLASKNSKVVPFMLYGAVPTSMSAGTNLSFSENVVVNCAEYILVGRSIIDGNNGVYSVHTLPHIYLVTEPARVHDVFHLPVFYIYVAMCSCPKMYVIACFNSMNALNTILDKGGTIISLIQDVEAPSNIVIQLELSSMTIVARGVVRCGPDK